MGLPPTQTQAVQSLQTPAPIVVAKYARNGLIPHAVLETELTHSLNFAAAIRGKNLFTWSLPIASMSASGGSRTRWRAAAHTSPLLRRLRAMIYAARNDADANAPAVTIAVTNANESTTYGTATLATNNNFGGSTSDDTPNEFISGELVIGGVPADTDVYIKVSDEANGRVLAVSIQEEMVKLISGNGYVLPAGVSVMTPIDAARRETLYELATTLWKRQAAHAWNWTVDNQASPITESAGTSKNIIDSSTSVSAATPGATLDLRYNRTRGLTTVPCVFRAYAENTGGAGPNAVLLKDSGGATVATISGVTTAGWYSTTVNLPASLAKYDIWFNGTSGGGTFKLGAVSLFQYA